MKKNKSSKALNWKQESQFNRYGNMSIVADDLLNGVKKMFTDDTIPIEEKMKRMELAEEATDLMLDNWCRFPTPEEKEKTKLVCKSLLWMAGFDAMLNPNKKNNVGVSHG